ncbi:MAG: hypothetical protein ABIH24_08185 [Verrucomicrobiota bacterium]
MSAATVSNPPMVNRSCMSAASVPGHDDLARVCGILNVRKDGDRMAEALPFGVGDATAGAENELLTVVTGSHDQVDLARTVAESNYFQNLSRRAAAGDASKSLVRDIKDFLADNRESAWENSWVYFPADLMTPYAQKVFAGDLYADKRDRGGARRSDSGRFEVRRNGIRCIRIPVSYLLKLALADAISFGLEQHPAIRDTGERLMRHFLNDNTSPETFSFHTVGPASGGSLGGALAEETLRRFLLVQFLTMYANEKFELRSRGQETLVCLAPHTPLRQKRLNELVADSFYRDLFMSPCLSGWDNGEAKHQYMIMCHEVLSRSRLNTMAKLRESGILALDLVTLPTVSNTSLANNGTHISLGSRRLTALMAAGIPEFKAEDEKRIGDLVVKIVEHFLPLFVGTYSAAPGRFDFRDFHPEAVLGFLPHELDFTHLRMLWRRWKGKADLKCCGVPITPFGPRGLDRFLGMVLGLRGDWVPDQRLIDYLVSPLSTDRSPALDGTIGNDERLKLDLAEMGVFDPRMSFYSLYRQRLFSRMGFCGFEGRHYSQFASITRDMAAATDLQRLITALAYQYVLTGSVTHADIPDTPEVESERRQIFFGAAIGIPTFFVDAQTPNQFLLRILNKTVRTRDSHRYPGRTRVYNAEYRRALVAVLEQDAAGLIEALGLTDTIRDLKRRINPSGEGSALKSILDGILGEAGASAPLRVSAATFNAAAERYYRGAMLKGTIAEALNLFTRDLKELAASALAGKNGDGTALRSALNGEDPTAFLETVRGNVLDGKVSQSVLIKLINLILLVVRRHCERNKGQS